jgi:hypothetical protein
MRFLGVARATLSRGRHRQRGRASSPKYPEVDPSPRVGATPLVMSRTGVAVAALTIVTVACSSGGSGTGGDGGPTAEGGSNEAAATSCSTPQDCTGLLAAGPAVFCCVHDVCIVGQAAEAQTCSDPASQNLAASSYDQSCQTDSDCIAVEEGSFCDPGANNGCTNAAINKSALPQYKADLAKTQASVCFGISGCTIEIGPCCRNGVCQVNGQCPSGVVPPPGDASADASGDAGDMDSAAASCSGAADCAHGKVCCVASALDQTPVCQAAPCPYLPGFGVFQLCATPAECVTAGDICAPQGGGRLPVPICQAPPGDGGPSDAPTG